MELSIILTTVLSTFATSADLCADVYADADSQPYTDSVGRTLPRYCKWTGPNPPKFAADVCCIIDEDGAACSLPDANGRCSWGVRRYCQHGEVGASGGVVCMQPFPNACALGYLRAGAGATAADGAVRGLLHSGRVSPGSHRRRHHGL